MIFLSRSAMVIHNIFFLQGCLAVSVHNDIGAYKILSALKGKMSVFLLSEHEWAFHKDQGTCI